MTARDAGVTRVVAAAIIRDGKVLAARRARPAQLAGGWEFAGGKVEPGESDEVALHRELREELGVAAHIGPLLDVAHDRRIELFLYQAELVTGTPTPLADHDELKWVGADGLATLEWLPIDRELLPAVARCLDQWRGER